MYQKNETISRIASRLLAAPQSAAQSEGLKPDWQPPVPYEQPPVAAAVMIALVRRGPDYAVVYTERSQALRAHSGQIAFPGGKVDPEDADAGAAALREAQEEINLDPQNAEIIGYMPPYFTGTNYLITPVVALVETERPFTPNPLEVNSIFEVPLPLIARRENYGTYRLRRGTVEHTTLKIEHEGHVIWGITANLTNRFRAMALWGDDNS